MMQRTGRALSALFALCLLPLFVACTSAPASAQRSAAPLPTLATPAFVASVSPASTPSPMPTATPAPTPYAIVWMSDTQEYASTYPEIFQSMTQYVAEQRDAHNLVYLLHTGDIINNAYTDHDTLNAKAAFDLLPSDLPILTACGNHDFKQLKDNQGVLQNVYSPYLDDRFDTDIAPEAEYLDGLSHYALFSAGGQDFLLLSIAYSKEKESVDWANEVCARYSDRIAILCTHSYLKASGEHSGPGKILFEGVVSASPNIRLVLSGHLPGAARTVRALDDDGDGVPDREVAELMFNYQHESGGGGGYLRLLTVDPLTGDVDVTTYSPWLDDFNYRDRQDAFILPGLFRPVAPTPVQTPAAVSQ